MSRFVVAVISTIISIQASATQDYWVKSDRVDRRACPSTQCDLVGQLFFQEKATVFEEKNGWSRISNYYSASCEGGRSEYIDSGNADCVESSEIQGGKFAEWVLREHLGTVRPEYHAKDAEGIHALVKGSDDYRTYKDAFAKATKELLEQGECSEADFQKMDGWMKTRNQRSQPVYFTYCGGMNISNKIYLDISSDQVFR